MGGALAFYRLRKVKNRYYLIKEYYDSSKKRKKTAWPVPVDRIERIYVLLKNLSDAEIARLVEIAKLLGKVRG